MGAFEHLSAAVLPLCVAFMNLLIAGQSLSGPGAPRARFAFGAAAAGVGVWAVAWFISVLDVTGVGAMQFVGSLGGVLAMLGFAVDGAGAIARSLRLRVLLGFGVLALLGGGAVLFVAEGQAAPPLVIAGALLRGAALGLLLLTATTELLRWRTAHKKARSLHRTQLLIIGCATLAYLIFAAVALLDGRQGVDPLLLVALVAEAMALAYIVEKRVEVRIVLTRAISYTLLSALIVGFAFVALRLAGLAVDLRELSLTLGVALVAVLVFLGLGEVMYLSIERLLFPARARLSAQLDLSRGEAASLRRRLERVERLAIAGELAATVAHEIKNPLSPIRGYAQLLSQRLEAVTPEQRPMFEKGLGIIQDEVDRIDRRVRDLLELSRAERGAQAEAPTIDLNRAVLEVIAVAEAEAPVHAIDRQLAEGSLYVRAAPDELRGALSNLMKNAAEALEPLGGGRIEVRTRREGEQAVAEIIDEGIGLTGPESDRAFEAFYTTKQGGTGLGLAIARSAIEAAGGQVLLRGRTDARGAVARVELPMVSPPGGQP